MRLNNKKMKMTAILMAAILSASVFMGCSEKNDTQQENTNTPSQEKDMANDPVMDAMGDESGVGAEGDVLAFKPADQGILPQEKYAYPYMGLEAVLTDSLLKKMEAKDVIMLTSEAYNEDYSLRYAAISWYALTEEQKNEEVTAFNPDEWKKGLAQIGVLGVYHKDAADELDVLTGCEDHKEVGKSADGTYVYYMSYADGADETLKKELEKTEVTVTKMQNIDMEKGITAFSEARVDASNLGDFKTTDINGNEYTKDMFRDYDLTLVNVMATWCSPCVEEMPEFEKFKQEMAEKGIGVAALVHDTVNDQGEVNQEIVEKAKLLAEKAKLTFPLLIPDETGLNGRLKGINGFPETFFVDKDGNIVGETYSGTHTFEEWKEIAEKELAKLKGVQ